MKKIIYIMLIIIVMYMWITKEKNIIIPEDSIRFRIIANSNDKIDQNTKLLIKKDLENNLFELIQESKSLEETREIIKNNEQVIKNTINKYNIPYSINYGENYFPEKEYKGITYKEGKYESLVITLGNGSGNNWWCVMYPPLCLLESTSEKYEDIEYKSFIKEIISQLTS
ncbi:MAG: stage II sporulation protein R [Candidatus Coprovivens sp.]